MCGPETSPKKPGTCLESHREGRTGYCHQLSNWPHSPQPCSYNSLSLHSSQGTILTVLSMLHRHCFTVHLHLDCKLYEGRLYLSPSPPLPPCSGISRMCDCMNGSSWSLPTDRAGRMKPDTANFSLKCEKQLGSNNELLTVRGGRKGELSLPLGVNGGSSPATFTPPVPAICSEDGN